MPSTIKWGIIGTGNIANQFAKGLQSVADAELLAIGSRSQATAEAFAAQYNIPRHYTSYEALAADPDIDVVYISTPHTYHKDNSLLCLENNKAVLCEKPFSLNAAEAQVMIDTARRKGIFLMEAMWSRFFPAMTRIRELLAAGTLGEIRQVIADFGFWIEFDPQHRLFNPVLGAGALLDVGIYPVSFASMVFGAQPEQIHSSAYMGQTGVDEQNNLLFSYDGGAMAALSSAMRVETPKIAAICGEKGRIDIHAPFFIPTAFTLTLNDQPGEVSTYPLVGNGYNYQAEEVGRCLRMGMKESDIMPLDETLALMQTLDRIRAQWGLKYPGES